MTDLGKVIQALHDSEINGKVEWFDDDVTVGIGDDIGGWRAEDTVYSFDSAAEWLRAEAIRQYPETEFAKQYGRGFA